MKTKDQVGNKFNSIMVRKNILKKFSKRTDLGVVVGLILVWGIFYILSPKFLWLSNIGSILTQASELCVIAVGVGFLLISGEFDLSIGSVYVIAPTIMIRVTQWLGIPIVIGFLFGIAFAALIGFINGTITLKFKLPSFITTLATMMLLSGILLAVTGGFISSFLEKNLWFDILAKRFGYIRMSTAWMILIVLLFHFILNYTSYGNWVYATGGNPTVALKMGINVKKVKMTNFIICSMLAGFAGCIAAARSYSISPTVGFDLMFNAMTAAIIGGCLITGGQGSIIGTFLGVMLVSSVNSGLILAGASPYWYRAFVGVVILVVVIINLRIIGKKEGY